MKVGPDATTYKVDIFQPPTEDFESHGLDTIFATNFRGQGSRDDQVDAYFRPLGFDYSMRLHTADSLLDKLWGRQAIHVDEATFTAYTKGEPVIYTFSRGIIETIQSRLGLVSSHER